MERRYFPAQIEAGEISYGVWFVDLPGCVSTGDTIADAIEGAHEALALHVAGMIEDGDPIPEPSEHLLNDVESWPEDPKDAAAEPRGQAAGVAAGTPGRANLRGSTSRVDRAGNPGRRGTT